MLRINSIFTLCYLLFLFILYLILYHLHKDGVDFIFFTISRFFLILPFLFIFALGT